MVASIIEDGVDFSIAPSFTLLGLAHILLMTQELSDLSGLCLVSQERVFPSKLLKARNQCPCKPVPCCEQASRKDVGTERFFGQSKQDTHCWAERGQVDNLLAQVIDLLLGLQYSGEPWLEGASHPRR